MSGERLAAPSAEASGAREVGARAAPDPPPVVVLGGGPAGLAAAYRLTQRGWRGVTVIERGPRVGGNAGSFVIDGIPVDFGSHRLHPACPPAVLADIRALIGGDLLDRPRHGRIRLRGRWVQFPLKPIDLMLRLPPAFMAGVIRDALRKPAAPARDTFASILERGLGRTICRDFYFPYAEKIWGCAPDALDPEQARRRVSSASLGDLIRRVARALPGVGPSGGARFFYPRGGYGQISTAFASACEAAGAHVRLETSVAAIHTEGGRVSAVDIESRGARETLPAAYVFSTIPLTALPRLVRSIPSAPAAAAGSLRLRSMVLVYLTLATDRFTAFDAHYFPERAIHISRLSEPKHYSLAVRAGRTVLCAELPCSEESLEWTMNDDALRALVVRDLECAGLGPLPAVVAVETQRLPHAYPIYTAGYREAFDAVDRWVGAVGGLVTFGRQGLFAHDNTHHAMATAYEAVDCLRADKSFDAERWARARTAFRDHVVED